MAELLTSVVQARAWRSARAGSVAAVYTMGALHSGHLALIERAKELADCVVVTIFVNPMQFNSAADLAAYPRSLDADLKLCADAKVDAVFAPTAEEMYPAGSGQISVDPGDLGEILEGESRPGHFRGVLTVVSKLTHILTPDFAVFGEKDFQQLSLIRLAARDLNWSTAIVGLPTVRDHDGLALSSRNVRLDPQSRRTAGQIPAALAVVRHRLNEGAAPNAAAESGRQYLAERGIDVDYLVVLSDSLTPTDSAPYRVLLAAHVGGVRLIDNIEVEA